nr:two-pore potassium channel 1-like [Tanacetum cinerariifolium]
MDCDGGSEPLLTEQQEPKPQLDTMVSAKSRKLRRCRSAPMEPILLDTNRGRFLERPRSVFDEVNPHYKRVAIYLFIYLSISTVCFYLVRNQISGDKTYGILDSIYFCVVTMTTVGYGDLIPSSTATKLLSCAFVFSGMALIGFSLSKAADCLVENQEILLVKALHLRQKPNSMEEMKEMETNRVRYRQRSLVQWVLTRKTTAADLEAADLDDDGVVGAAEFVIFKLKEMGKISPEDVSLILTEFRNLDVDESGSLSPSDIYLAQSARKDR